MRTIKTEILGVRIEGPQRFLVDVATVMRSAITSNWAPSSTGKLGQTITLT
jgi:hypothetical protein